MSQFVYKGSVQDLLILEGFATINYHGVPGVFQVASDDCIRRVYFQDGDIISAFSNRKEDRLGEFLLSRDRLTEEQLDEIVEAMENSDGKRKIGQILVERNYMKPRELYGEVIKQAENIVLSLFRIRDGKTKFTCGPLQERGVSKIPLNTKLLLYTGVKECLNEVEIKEVIHSITRVLKPTPGLSATSSALAGMADEIHVLGTIDGDKNIAEVVRDSKMNTFDTLKFITFLLLTRAVE